MSTKSTIPTPPRDAWYIAAASKNLTTKVQATSLFGTPIALFRDEHGRAGALEDRCPHRNVPLSLGKVREGTLECAYHGWRFDCDGICRSVPGLVTAQSSAARDATSYPVAEQDGFVWIYGTPNTEPTTTPFQFPHIHEAGYSTVRSIVEMDAAPYDVAENALDVPHTAYLHGGLFRTQGQTSEIEVVVRRWSDRVEAEYIGERRPSGIVGRLLAPQGGTVVHHDRFYLPAIVQVEYRLGDTSHFCVTAAITPLEPRKCRLFAVINFRVPIPHWIVAPIVRPIAMRIFRQDARMLARQTQTIEHFDGERYTSTEIDVLGAQIQRLLRRAAKGDLEPEPDDPEVKRLRMAT